MREALAISSEEGLKEQWQRHENMHHMLWDGLKSMGLKSFVENDSERLITVNTITVRQGASGCCRLVPTTLGVACCAEHAGCLGVKVTGRTCGWCFATCACTCRTEQAIDVVPVFVMSVASMKLCHQQLLFAVLASIPGLKALPLAVQYCDISHALL